MIWTLSLFFVLQVSAALPEAQTLLNNWKDAMYTPHEASKFRMTITPEKGDPIVREADIFYRSENRKEVKILMRFTSPAKIKGTSFLSLKKTQADSSDQWIYFPAYKKARRLSSRKKEDPFLDSDFSNGDISFEYHRGYTFKVIKEVTIGGKPVYVLEGIAPASEETLYGKQVLYIAKKDNLNLKSEFYDKKGVLIKEFIVKKWAKYGTHWAIDEGLMKNLTNKSETSITFMSRDPDTVPADKIFTMMNLERGL
ncbi:MAG: outer membrane lipoprotein-sorting protein [Proteobacteria bacterium]|jgi:hypothetical protein|nr:outer membrane lipoprotein-sorting protein [Pseudomonadota bacterium]